MYSKYVYLTTTPTSPATALPSEVLTVRLISLSISANKVMVTLTRESDSSTEYVTFSNWILRSVLMIGE